MTEKDKDVVGAGCVRKSNYSRASVQINPASPVLLPVRPKRSHSASPPKRPRSPSPIQSTTPDTECAKVLTELAKQLTSDDTEPFKNVMIVAMQHILGTTVDMFKVLQRLGLQHLVIGGKSYSTHLPSVKALKDLSQHYIFIDAPGQLGYGTYNESISSTVTRIWNAAKAELEKFYIKLIIILDDGGNLLLSTPTELIPNGKWQSCAPKHIIGIEQTRGGANHNSFNGTPFPIINVAGSYIKTTIEYPFIAEIIANKVIEKIDKKMNEVEVAEKKRAEELTVGVIGGYGALGQAILSKFSESSKYAKEILFCDLAKGKQHNTAILKNKEKDGLLIKKNSVHDLIMAADIIIGCTGSDVTKEDAIVDDILKSMQPKYFVSTSSKDIEFNNLLIHIQRLTKKINTIPKVLEDIRYPEKAPNIVIFRGGFPLNFDNSEHSVPPEKIWPTRAALLGACLMAVQVGMKKLKKPEALKLDPKMQATVIKKYLERIEKFSSSASDLATELKALKRFSSFESLQKLQRIEREKDRLEYISQHSDGAFFESLLDLQPTPSEKKRDRVFSSPNCDAVMADTAVEQHHSKRSFFRATSRRGSELFSVNKQLYAQENGVGSSYLPTPRSFGNGVKT